MFSWFRVALIENHIHKPYMTAFPHKLLAINVNSIAISFPTPHRGNSTSPCSGIPTHHLILLLLTILLQYLLPYWFTLHPLP